MIKIEKHSVEEHARSLAQYFPGGKLWAAVHKDGTNLNKLIKALARTLAETECSIMEFQEQFMPDKTVLFLDEWEKALGIPDDCFKGTGSQDERRLHILVKLASLGVQTAEDFENLAAKFGINVTVRGGITNIKFPLTFPIIFFDTEKEARFTIVVEFNEPAPNAFPLTFPISFGNGVIGILECLFRKLKPANCDIIFQQV